MEKLYFTKAPAEIGDIINQDSTLFKDKDYVTIPTNDLNNKKRLRKIFTTIFFVIFNILFYFLDFFDLDTFFLIILETFAYIFSLGISSKLFFIDEENILNGYNLFYGEKGNALYSIYGNYENITKNILIFDEIIDYSFSIKVYRGLDDLALSDKYITLTIKYKIFLKNSILKKTVNISITEEPARNYKECIIEDKSDFFTFLFYEDSYLEWKRRLFEKLDNQKEVTIKENDYNFEFYKNNYIIYDKNWQIIGSLKNVKKVDYNFNRRIIIIKLPQKKLKIKTKYFISLLYLFSKFHCELKDKENATLWI